MKSVLCSWMLLAATVSHAAALLDLNLAIPVSKNLLCDSSAPRCWSVLLWMYIYLDIFIQDAQPTALDLWVIVMTTVKGWIAQIFIESQLSVRLPVTGLLSDKVIAQTPNHWIYRNGAAGTCVAKNAKGPDKRLIGSGRSRAGDR